MGSFLIGHMEVDTLFSIMYSWYHQEYIIEKRVSNFHKLYPIKNEPIKYSKLK